MKLEQHQLARELYLYTDRTITDIADSLSVDRKTIYNWSRKDGWEELKIAARQRPQAILHTIYGHIDEVNNKVLSREDRCPTMQEVEMLRKLIGITAQVQKSSAGQYLQAFGELRRFAHQTSERAADVIATQADEFIDAVLKSKRASERQFVADITYTPPQPDQFETHQHAAPQPGQQIHIEEIADIEEEIQQTNGKEWGIFGEEIQEVPVAPPPSNPYTVRLYDNMHLAVAHAEFPITSLLQSGENTIAKEETRLTTLRHARFSPTFPRYCYYFLCREVGKFANTASGKIN